MSFQQNATSGLMREPQHGRSVPAVPTSVQHAPPTPNTSLPATILASTLALTQVSRTDFDTTGQIAPPGMKPQVAATRWEDEGSLCYYVKVRGIYVARRGDNNMINGTRLLSVAGMTRGRRDGILRCEHIRHVVKIGPMHVKGVWIPFERALDFANKEKITDILYPLFVHDIRALLGHPAEELGGTPAATGMSIGAEDSQPSSPSASPSSPWLYSQVPETSKAETGRLYLSCLAQFPTPPTSASSVSVTGYAPPSMTTDTQLSQICSLPNTPATTPTIERSFWGPEGSTPSKQPHPSSSQHTLTSSLQLSPTSDTETVSSNMASDCSTSSQEDGTLLTRVEQKRILLRRLMRFFYLIISSSPSPAANARVHGCNGSQDGSSSPRSSSTHQAAQNLPGNPMGREIAPKRRREGGSDGGDADDGRDNKRLRSSESATQAELPAQRLACPFFKKNRARYRKWRSCPGPGWATVHRIKEHIYRKHGLPTRCPRCHQIFETERQKDDHISQDERCLQMEDTNPPEGIDADKEKLLRSRKGKNKEASEIEKWNEMYLILFPEADAANLPTPYYEYSSAETNTPGSPSGEFTRYEQFLRRELPGKVRQELETRIEERLNPIEESLRGELVEIVRDMQLQLFELYKASRDLSSGAHTELALAPEQQTAVPIGESVQDIGQLEAFSQPPFVNTESFLPFESFDGQIWDTSALDSQTLWGWDSGYGSLSGDPAQDGQCLDLDNCARGQENDRSYRE